MASGEIAHDRVSKGSVDYKAADVRFCIVGSGDGTTGQGPTVTVIGKHRVDPMT